MENEKAIDIMNDLISINNDRIEGYEKASDELKAKNPKQESEILEEFEERIQESRVFRNELTAAVNRQGGTAEDSTTTRGEIYRLWMDLKNTFTGGSSKSVLESCEYGEDAALSAYDKALEQKMQWPEETLVMITRQRQILKMAHNLIKRYRDDSLVKT